MESKLYRVFTNDRRPMNGVPMYSAFADVMASCPEIAQKRIPPQFNAPNCAPAVAIRWPSSAQSDDEKEWLKKHVGKEL